MRTLALGLQALGLGKGDRIAVIGANRPRLYWTFAAAQSLGAVPVPVYADAVADEMAYVLDHAGVRFAVVQDQEQVDKIRSCAGKIPALTDIIYDEPRGLAGYPPAGLHAFSAVQDARRERCSRPIPTLGRALGRRRSARRAARTSRVMLYTSGTTGRSKGVMLKAASAVQAARDTVGFDGLNERDSVLAYLPLAWVGDHYLNYAQGYVAGLLHELPGEPRDGAAGSARDRADLLFRAAAHLRSAAHQRHHPHGGCRLAEAEAVLAISSAWRSSTARRSSKAGRCRCPAGSSYALGELLVYGPLKNVLGFSNIRVAYTAGEAIGQDLFSFFRSLGINLKQLYGQTEAFLYVTVPEGRRGARRYGRAGGAQCRHPHLR